MDLHIYRNSQDRWHDLKSAARARGAILAVNAVTLDELVRRLTPGTKTPTAVQRLLLIHRAIEGRKGNGAPIVSETVSNLSAKSGTARPVVSEHSLTMSGTSDVAPFFSRYASDAIHELKGAGVQPSELRAANSAWLGAVLEAYDAELGRTELIDPQDRVWLAAERIAEAGTEWLKRFRRAVLHALYDLNEAEFTLLRRLLEALPDGGTVMLFNTTANVKPTQFAEWTWQRFVHEESLSDRAYPEFCRSSHPHREILERLFVFEPGASQALDSQSWLRILQAPGRYREIEKIGADIAGLLDEDADADEIAVIVRHIDSYGEMIEDVFSRYAIPHIFETGVPLLRVPFIKYWLAMLDLVTSERSREALGRVMASAYYEPRLSPRFDIEQELAACGYFDRVAMPASKLAARKHSALAMELERLEQRLDECERSTGSVVEFLKKVPPPAGGLPLRDIAAWRVLVEELEAVSSMAGPVTFGEFRRIASDAAGTRSVDRLGAGNTGPPGAAKVRILHPHSLGYREYRWIFAPGLADAEFPARAMPNPVLPDRVIDDINRMIRPRRIMTAKNRNRREPLYFFMLLDSAIDCVTLTFPGNTVEGETAYPSIYIREIERHCSASPLERLGGVLPARETGEYLRRIAKEWRQHRIEDRQAAALLGEDIVRRIQWERLGTGRADIGEQVLSADVLWTPSELNALEACPFVFLARHRLKLRSHGAPGFDVPASEMGILAHRILREFHGMPIPPDFEAARCRMNEIAARHLPPMGINGADTPPLQSGPVESGALFVADPVFWEIRRHQLVGALIAYADFAVRDAAAGFETQREYLDAPLPQAKLGRANVAGRPDRVAVHRAPSRSPARFATSFEQKQGDRGGRVDGIRIDDFKYSASSSSTVKQLKRSFQIPIYAWLARQALGAGPGARIEGRYLLLRSPGNPVVSYEIDEGMFDDVRGRVERLLEKVSRGELHPDPADRQDCHDCDYRRLCRFYGD